MRTVSLRRRVVGAGVAVVAVVLAGVNVFVYLSVRDHLLDGLREVLDNKAELAEAFAPSFTPEELATLAGSEIVVSVRRPDGSVAEGSPNPIPPGDRPAGLTRRVELPDGTRVVLTASRQSVDQTLGWVVLSQVLSTTAGLALAVFLLTRAARRALLPIDAVVTTARQIQSGRRGERLRPDRTDTELGRMALAFDEMLDALEAAVAEARASDEAGRRFLAEAAHQLRTPIAGIQASVEALPAARDDAERDELLTSVARESARAGRRVAALLRMARLDLGGEPVRRTCDIVALTRDEVDRTASLAPQLTVTLRAERRAYRIEVDPDAVREALANVLDNARRHAASGIAVTLSAADAGIEVRVDDDGPGLPRADAERVFERFVSLDGRGGSGLGLAIARGIARSHGGDVRYHDRAFVITIPDAVPKPNGQPPPGGPVSRVRAAS